jgi:hypothetical protein
MWADKFIVLPPVLSGKNVVAKIKPLILQSQEKNYGNFSACRQTGPQNNARGFGAA